MRIAYLMILFLSAFQCYGQLADCSPPISQAELNINNVRAQISNGLQHFEVNGSAGYQIPKVAVGEQGVHSIYADAIWVGGYSADEQLHLAAITYRTGGGTDFYPGPLRTNGFAETEAEVCDNYDEVFVVARSEAMLHRDYQLKLEQVANGADESILTEYPFENGYQIPESFYDWPAINSNPGYSNYLAPFYDWNADGQYDPEDGDYPGFDLDGNYDCQDIPMDEQLPLMGHQAAWYVCNDAGLHTETGGTPLGIEIQVMAYAYAHCDALNDATFSRNILINRSSNTYSDCVIGKWVDMDAGCPTDDYVACDVARGMAYSYNGDDDDFDCDGVPGYGHQLVAQGVTFLAGPLQDEDGTDNPLTVNVALAIEEDGIVYPGQGTGYGDGISDNERFGMRNFLYYNRDLQTGVNIYGEPNIAIEFYQYISSTWKNGNHVTYGAIGTTGTIESDYMFPGTSDPLGTATDGQVVNGDWSEESIGTEPGDRRFVLSTGSFTMEPGEINELTVGYIWAQDTTGASNAVELLKERHDIIQGHFDNCFELVDPYPVPDAFNLVQNGATIQVNLPLFSAENVSWDFGDGASAIGLTASHTYSSPGYYAISASHDLCGALRSISDSIYIDPSDFNPSLQITRTEGRGCGMNWIELEPEEIGHMLQGPDYYEPELTYLQDSGPIKVCAYDEDLFIPGDYAIRLFGDHIDRPEEWKLWRVGETDTIYSEESMGQIHDQYIPEFGLVVSIAQPDHYSAYTDNGMPELLGASMTFEDPTETWLTGVADTDDFTEQNWIRSGNFIISNDDCDDDDPNDDCYYNDKANVDHDEEFEDILGGTWAPWHLVSQGWTGPAWFEENYQVPSSTRLTDLNNVLIRFTSDKSLWTRSPVLENGHFPELTIGITEKNHMRRSLSVDKNGQNQLNGGNYDECTLDGTQVFDEAQLQELDAAAIEAYIIAAFPGQDPSLFSSSDLLGLAFGMSWFPGYAVDIETGYRLNIMFSENSGLAAENGADMIWNPTSQVWNPFNASMFNPFNARFGGGHYIYILRNHIVDQASNSPIRMPGYDHGQFCYLNLNLGTERKRVFRAVTWVGLPLLAQGHSFLSFSEGLIPTETTIQLGVSKKYRGQMYDTFDEDTERFPLYNFTVPEDLFFNDYDEGLTVDLGLYPNPASDEVHVSLGAPYRVIAQLRVFDYTGRELQKFEGVSSSDFNLNISNLSSGTYLIQVIDDVGKAYATRFIVR